MKPLYCAILLFFGAIQFYAQQTKGHTFSNYTNPASVTDTSVSAIMNINKFTIPFDNCGNIAGNSAGSLSGGIWDSITILYSSGFYVSGKSAGTLWANGVFATSRILDYKSGKVGDATASMIYTIRKGGSDFNSSWMEWKQAVSLGAPFYDGNSDGIYNPVDLNNNGKWDPGEDRPDLIGDRLSWCVYNDGVPSASRKYTDVNPMGIEIRQSIFASGNVSALTNGTVFVRYSLLNTGSVAQQLDSVYFSLVADPDIGDYADDLVGCDSAAASGYAYQTAPDSRFGNAPAIWIDLLQGPYSYIPGTTFIDANSNGIYDPGETALDTAYNRAGPNIGIKKLPGAKNLSMNSFTQYMGSHPTQGDPKTKNEVRNYQIGGTNQTGASLNPCAWSYGSVLGTTPCASVNPVYMYSGNPQTGSGWLNTTPMDQRMMVTTGPFNLTAGNPVDIIFAYIAGRGTSSLNSLLLASQMDAYVKNIYKNNFTNLLSEVKPPSPQTAPSDFALMQNYPNPFNPGTIIRYSVGGSESSAPVSVKLKVYDMLGREVALLVNASLPAGSYEVTFDGSKLSGGVYFYTLQSGNYTMTKKLVLMK